MKLSMPILSWLTGIWNCLCYEDSMDTIGMIITDTIVCHYIPNALFNHKGLNLLHFDLNIPLILFK